MKTDKRRTLELDIAVDKTYAMHPANSLAQLTKHPAEERLIKACVTLGIVDEIK